MPLVVQMGLSIPQSHDGLVMSMNPYRNEHDPDAPTEISVNN